MVFSRRQLKVVEDQDTIFCKIEKLTSEELIWIAAMGDTLRFTLESSDLKHDDN